MTNRARLCLKSLAQARERGIRLAGKDGEAGNALALSMQPDAALSMQPDAARRAKTRSKPVTDFSDRA